MHSFYYVFQIWFYKLALLVITLVVLPAAVIAQSLPGSGNTITFNGATTYINCGTADRGISKTTITAEAWIKTSSSAIQFAVTKYSNSLFSESGFQLGTSGGQAGTFGRVGLGIY